MMKHDPFRYTISIKCLETPIETNKLPLDETTANPPPGMKPKVEVGSSPNALRRFSHQDFSVTSFNFEITSIKAMTPC